MKDAVATLLGVCALVGAAPAAAQQWPPPPTGDTTHTVFGEIGFGATSDDDPAFDASLTVVSPVLGARFTVADPVQIGVLWGFSYASLSFDSVFGTTDESAVAVGNPYVEGTYGLDLDGASLRFGGGLTLPLADHDDDDPAVEAARAFGLLGAMAIRGIWNIWLWAPDHFSLPIVGRVESDPDAQFHFLGELGFALMLDAGDDADGTSVVFQTAGEAGARFEGDFIVGGRLQVVAGDEVDDNDPRATDEDNAQVSMAPFFRYEAERFFLNAYLVINLDEPFGFSFDSEIEKIWGFHVGGGGRF